MTNSYAPTARSRIKRLHKRGNYDHKTIYEILDAGLLAHVGYVINNEPYVTPTCYWREGNKLYWHGSSASRMLRTMTGGISACVTVSHMDGLVLARSAFHHSINYRSVMAYGTAYAVTDMAEVSAGLEAFMERIAPGRWHEARQPTAQELKATLVVGMEIDEASAKIRTGPPIDDDDDYALPVWAGVIPLSLTSGTPLPDPRLDSKTPISNDLNNWQLNQNSFYKK